MSEKVGKLLDKLQQEGESAVKKVLAVPAKPERLAVLTAKAVIFVLASRRYSHLMAPNALQMQIEYLNGVLDASALKDRYSNPSYRSFIENFEAKTFPGLMTQIVLRKRKIEDLARNAYRLGVRQFVHLNAGFDTLLTRLASEHSDAMCIELDLPSNQLPKKAILKRKPHNLHFVNLDLREPHLAKVMMATPAYDPKVRTFFIAEALFPFLDDDDIDRIFSFMADHAAQHSRLVFTFFEKTHDGRATYPEQGFLTDMVLRLNRVQFEWGLRYENAAQFLNDRYFGLLEIHTARDLREKAPQPIPPTKRGARSEILAYAELVHRD